MSFRIAVNTINWLPVLLLSSSDGLTPITGVAYNASGLTVKYMKEGGTVQTKSLQSGDWSEGADGLYRVRFSADECNTRGLFEYWVIYSGADTSYQAGKVTYLIAGEGAVQWTYTITDKDTDLPIPDVEVWITNDEDGEYIIAGPQRSTLTGITTWYLDPGTYYIWRQKGGYNFTNPDVEIVS